MRAEMRFIAVIRRQRAARSPWMRPPALLPPRLFIICRSPVILMLYYADATCLISDVLACCLPYAAIPSDAYRVLAEHLRI